MRFPKKRSAPTEITSSDPQKILGELRVMAYFNWLHAGCPFGRDIEFWCQAERDMFGWTMGEFEASVKEMNDRMLENFKKADDHDSTTCG